MKSKLLTLENDLEIFATKCDQMLNLRYPKEYLKRSMVRAFYNKDGAMAGGYILAFQGPFRVIESLPDHIKTNSHWTQKEVLDNTYEVTGLWLDKKVASKKANFKFWVTLYKDLIFNKKKYFVYAYDLEKSYLKDLYSIVKPEVIYAGQTKIMEGMKKPCEESIEIASVNYIRFGIVYGWDYFAKKLILSRKSTNKYGVALFTKYGQHINVFNLKLPIVNKDNKYL
jgi:hypothetical protein